MSDRRDPITRRSGGEDVYDVTGWEVRSALDRASVWLYGILGSVGRSLVILLAGLILLFEVVLGGVGVLTNPVIGAFIVLSAVPALALAAYVWYLDVTPQEPLSLLVGTFVLGVLFAGFAGVVNTIMEQGFLSATGMETLPLVGLAVFYFLVVGPVEETVKLLAVRLYAYRDDRFRAVIDGAVYGAMAGLGFATIENAIYITQSVMETPAMGNVVLQGGATATIRALAGPGHVIYSAFAGYYLGLARFNRGSAGPIVVKGLLIAAVIHGTYNTLVSFLPAVVGDAAGIPPILAFLGFVVVYDVFFGALLFRKLARYRRVYRSVHADVGPGPRPERTEFDP